MKKKNYTLVLCIISLFFLPTIQAQDVAICGFDASGGTSTAGDEFSFVLLRDFAAGEVIYFTEDEYSDAANVFFSGEGHLAYTVPAGGLLENEVVRIFENGANTFDVQCLSGASGTAVHLSSSGTWSYSGSDELYAYSASNPTSPWSSVIEIHCFYYGAVIVHTVDQDPLPDYPNVIKLAVNLGASVASNADFNNAARTNTTLADLQNTANWTKSTSGITLSCTDFTTQMIALPVELIHFEVSKRDKNIMVHWSTASEINNDFFQVEHSVDGVQFDRIEYVKGVGNSVQINHYNALHKNPTNGVNYYRLKQVDYDGLFAYSDIVSIEFREEKNEVSVFPNPFTESITVKTSPMLNNSFNGERTIEVFDIHNRLVQTNKFSTDDNITRLNLSQLYEGIYFIKIAMGNGDSKSIRILKQKNN